MSDPDEIAKDTLVYVVDIVPTSRPLRLPHNHPMPKEHPMHEKRGVVADEHEKKAQADVKKDAKPKAPPAKTDRKKVEEKK